MNPIELICGDCFKVMRTLGQFDMVFADPPDNQKLDYDGYLDNLTPEIYESLLMSMVNCSAAHAPICWFSFNARHTITMGALFYSFIRLNPLWEVRSCVQIFTFGQHNKNWLGNGHRPLWCLFRKDAKFYPDQIHVESWRQQHGDKRAAPGGRVPDDVFDYARVVGNSKQRRAWHSTQLHEGILERCIRFCTLEGGSILDPFAGTATTGRVAKRIGRRATLIEQSALYCSHISEELATPVIIPHELTHAKTETT